MASSASDLIKFEKQADGENSGSWGTKANTAMSRIEEAIAAMTNITVTGADYTLNDTQYTEHNDGSNTSESHVAMVKATGTLTGNRKIIVPLRTKKWMIWNATGGAYALSVGGSSGDAVTVPQGYLQEVFCDGTNVEAAGIAFGTAGQMNLNGQTIFDTNGAEMFKFTETGSAVNELTWKNEAAGSNPGATASGGDTNIGINFIPKGTGQLQQAGTAVGLTGKHGIPIAATGMYTRTTSGAAEGTAETSTNKVMIKTWDFDTSADEYVQFQIPMWKSWNESTVTAVFYWSHPSTSTNFGVSWAIQGQSLGNSDALDQAFGTAVVVDDTGGTTDDIFISSESGNVTLANTPAEKDIVVFQVFRDVSDANDTMAVDARLHGIMLFVTTNSGNDA